ncbi:MAG: glycoside hydrolase family 2 [Bacteroidia bacterium]|nr:glycoside hydrolase family 2 [Bacteroidia bacterium]
MKRLFLLAFFTISILACSAQKTEIEYLSGTDKDHPVKWDFFCTHGRNSGSWSKIAVPSCWELQGFGSYLYGKTNLEANEKGLYKYEFTLPASWEKKEVFIVFEGSMTDTEVKINGQSAGPVHQGSFYRFRYDITGLLKYRTGNLLEVTVSKESANTSINRAERMSDYWVFGGIFRPVYLEAFPLQRIDRVAIDAKADGTFYMDVFTEGKGKAKSITAQVETPDGKLFGNKLSALIDQSGKTILKGSFTGASQWNPEFPNMYQVVVSINKGKKPVHQITQKFGFRTIEIRESDGIYVNGVKIMFKGVCRHTFWPSSGRTSSKELAVNDVKLMKEMNMNAVRMSHYPPDQYFLDVCDSLGMFVLDELAGWQKFYDTPTAQRLVRQMFERDVNHPSIVLWDNGNEGGFNKDVRGDYALYDPQKRTVIEPWSVINGTNTKHYPGYKYVENALNNGKEIFFPTEFLHGLYDGGHGAGLDDHWNLMMTKPLAAGAFMWVFADEGVERKDLNDSIDTDGNRAPDGILGPYHEKEGSFYTIKEIWAPVQFEAKAITSDFDGKFKITNRYLYTNLNKCKFTYDLVRFEKLFPDITEVIINGPIVSPDITPGKTGTLNLLLPADLKRYDVLYITATDQYGMVINKWSWNITRPSDLILRTVKIEETRPSASEANNILVISTGSTEIAFDKSSGILMGVKYMGKPISFCNGLRFAGFNATFSALKYYPQGNSYVVELKYNERCRATWTIFGGGWLKLDYEYAPSGELDYAGITFSYPEELVTGATLLANGPYHVWKNRLKGTQFGLYEKKYNNTITGESWDYPEFKGYYSNFYGVQIQTRELPITILSGSEDLFLHLFTPGTAKYSTRSTGVRGEVNPPFPEGNISFLHGISPIGTKFTKADAEGPQSQKNKYNGETLKGTLYFRFGD